MDVFHFTVSFNSLREFHHLCFYLMHLPARVVWKVSILTAPDPCQACGSGPVYGLLTPDNNTQTEGPDLCFDLRFLQFNK